MATRKTAAKTAKTAKTATKTARTTKASKAAKVDDAQALQKVKTFSHDLLLAGIGAWASSRDRDRKTATKDKGLPDFATLVREGRKAEPELKASLQKTWDEWKEKSQTSRLSKSGDQLRGVFDERVSAAISGLGLPTRKEIDALAAKVDRLMGQKAAAGKPAAKKSASRAARKTATGPLAASGSATEDSQ